MSESQEHSAGADHVGTQTRRGISWNFGAALVINTMRVVVLVVLGRALTSTDFGIVAAAVSVNVVVYGIRDIGLGPALIQRKDLQPAHLTTAFAITSYLGVVLTAGLFLGAPAIGRLYGIPESVDVMRVMGLLFGLRNLAATSRMMCYRAMNFRAIAIVDAASFTLGSTVAMITAIAGAGPWALVLGYLVEEVISTGAFLRLSPPKWSLRVDPKSLRELLSFGGGQTLTQLASVGATYGDNFVVGNALGATQLGFYTRAYDLIKMPSFVFDAIVGSVLFPAFSRLQDDRPALATNFRRVAFVDALVLLPMSAALVVLAPETIGLVLGDDWDGAVAPFQILAVTMLLRTSQKLASIVAQAGGLVNGIAIATVIYMCIVIGGAAISIHWGIAGVACSTAIAITSVSCMCTYLALRVSRLPLRALVAAHGHGLVLAGVVVAVTWPLAHALRTTTLAPWLVFASLAALSVLVCLAIVAIWLRRGRGDFAWLGGELARIRRRKRSP